MEWTGGSGGGVSGSAYVFFGLGDMLEYNFNVDENSPPIVFSIQREEDPKITMATFKESTVRA